MFRKQSYSIIVLVLVIFVSAETKVLQKFDRDISAKGFPYYKLIMSMGHCESTEVPVLLFQDDKVYPPIRLNRLLEIHYKSGNPKAKVKLVQISVILNNTDCIAYTNTGVNVDEFKATFIQPTNGGLLLYTLKVYSCAPMPHVSASYEDTESGEEIMKLIPKPAKRFLPFLSKNPESPFTDIATVPENTTTSFSDFQPLFNAAVEETET